MERGVPRRRRPGPVVAEGVQALLARGEELAKGWLLALVEDAPLESAAAILAGDVARDGPRICDAVVGAIYDEADLRRIQAGGVLEPLVARAGELAGVRSAEGAAHAVDALRSVVWSALRSELARTDLDLLADAGERLSFVAETIRAAVLRRHAEGEAGGATRPRVGPLPVARTDVQPASRGGAVAVEEPVAAEARAGEGGGFEHGGAAEHAKAPPSGAADHPTKAPPSGAADHPTDTRAVGEAPWIGALRDEIGRAGRARAPLSLLLVELEEAERLLAAETRGEASAIFGRFAQAVRTALRHRDVLACETESRAWIIARDTGRAGAQALGTRIVTAVPTRSPGAVRR